MKDFFLTHSKHLQGMNHHSPRSGNAIRERGKMEAQAVKLFKKWCAPTVGETVININGRRIRVVRIGRKITVEIIGKETENEINAQKKSN